MQERRDGGEVMHTPGVVFLRDEAVSVDCCTGGPKVMPEGQSQHRDVRGRGEGDRCGREGMGGGVMHTPPVDFLPRKFDHPLSNSLGGGLSPCVVLLRVTRGMPSLVGASMLRGKRKRQTQTKGEEEEAATQFQPFFDQSTT